MKNDAFTLLAGLILFTSAAFAQETSHEEKEPKEAPVTTHATGTFDVRIAPLDLHFDGDKLGRLTIDKAFHGDLEATSQGEMLTAGTDTEGSAVYVAIERVTGTVNGKKGSFTLHHRGIMNRGEAELVVKIVPDSGAGELEGISGEMKIRIEDGKHFYDFEYVLP